MTEQQATCSCAGLPLFDSVYATSIHRSCVTMASGCKAIVALYMQWMGILLLREAHSQSRISCQMAHVMHMHMPSGHIMTILQRALNIRSTISHHDAKIVIGKPFNHFTVALLGCEVQDWLME